ncbi:hypothetical protein ACFU51_01340 [Streptomyces sp. NPDC057430]|uniref:hypothetical protein n=1 Tax=Streptomyces sp. NPDC057430 TaxID=3346131 RepID=UPI00369C4C53
MSRHVRQRPRHTATGEQGRAQRIVKLLARVEQATGKPWPLALHADRCPRGRLGLSPLRDATTVPRGDVLAWYENKRWPQPPCPLCVAPTTKEIR